LLTGALATGAFDIEACLYKNRTSEEARQEKLKKLHDLAQKTNR